MIGIVEIYKNFGTPEQELLSKENNLIVNGAGETICNLLTTPSSIVSAVPGITDSSNYTIQAFSLGKSSTAYKENGHFYPFDLSSHVLSSGEYYMYVSSVKGDQRIRAVSFEDENIQITTSSYDPRRDPGTSPNVNDTQLEPNTETALDAVSGQYHYMGSSIMQGRSHSVGHNLNKLSNNSNPNLLSYTNGPQTDAPLAYWTSANIATATLSGTHTGPFYGTSAYYVSSTYNTVGSLRQSSINLWKTSFHDNVDHTLSVYIKQPEFGNETSGFTMHIRDKTGTAVNHIATFSLWDSTAGKHIPPEFVTGTNGILGSVTPVVSETSSTGWYRLDAYLEGLGTDANTVNGDQVEVRYNISNGSPTGGSLFMWGWQLEESYGASKYQTVSAVNPTFAEGGLEGDIFQGCYPHTSGTDYAILSSISNMDDAYRNFYASGTYPKTPGADNFFNSSSVRSMDSNGFVRAYNPSSTTAFTNNSEGRGPIYPNRIADPASGLIVSAANKAIQGTPGHFGFSGTGEVSAICTISSGDLGTANMYGGLFKLGLWTIDLERTLSKTREDGQAKAVPSFPLKFGAGYNKLVYKLFAEKNLSKNIGIIKDAGSVAGHSQYDDLTVVWRLNFI